MRFHCRHGSALILVVLVAAFGSVARAASSAVPTVEATIEPTEIAVGDSAQLTITTSGSLAPSVALPKVSGLDFRLVGQSRRLQIINGATLSTSSLVYRVTPEAVGIYTIPGLTPTAQPLVLRVTSGESPPSTSLPGGTAGSGIRLTPDGSAFVRLSLPKHEIYVGESIPVEIQVGMRDGFVSSLNGIPTLKGGEFTLNNLSRQPAREEKVIEGKPFTVLTWRSVLSAVKPGTFSLAMETPLTVRIRTRPQRDSMMDDMLGDPFLQNFFGATVAKDITVTSPTAQMSVLALPTEGRPADFNGAVGSFKIASDLSSATSTVGDPLTLRMHVSGSGNFDRVDSAMLDRLDRWKTYPPKPIFNPGDGLGYRGEKIFEQPVIASQPGKQTLPGLAFSYFDPNTKRYETAHSAPLTVTVSPSPDEVAKNTSPAEGKAAAPLTGAHPGLRPDHVETEARVSSLLPPYLRPRLLAIPSALCLMFAGAWLLLRRQRRAASDAQRAHDLKLAQLEGLVGKQLQAASAAGDTRLFFNTARGALQQSLAARFGVETQEITAAAIDERLGGDSEAVRQIFILADEANYSGRELKATDYQRWTEVVLRQFAAGKTP